jgi:hypothetical protein
MLTAFAAGDQTGLIISQRLHPALFPQLPEKRAGSATPLYHSRTLVQHLVNEAVRLRVVAGHEIVAVRVTLDAIDRLTRVMGQ